MKHTSRSFRILHLTTCAIAGISFVLGGANLLRVRSTRGMPLRALKSIFQSLAPFLAISGIASAFLAGLIRAPFAAVAGAAGALLSARYVFHISRQHKAFDYAFGSQWRTVVATKVTPEQRRRMLTRRWTWRLPRPDCEPCWQRDIVYHTVDGQNLLCDLWVPPAHCEPSGLALVYVHGGGYYNGCKDFGTRALFRHLAAQGHVVMDIEYRLAPKVGLFEMVADVRQAVAWMKANARSFGADPNRVVLMGGSAGGQLALLAAYAPDHPLLPPAPADCSVRAVVSYYGVADMSAAYHKVRTFFANAPRWRPVPEHIFDRTLTVRAIGLAARFRDVEPDKMRASLMGDQARLVAGLEASMAHVLGGSPEAQPERYRLASPLTFAGANCPPTLLFQGTHDYLLPVGPTRALYRKLRAAGVRAVYVELPETEHTFDLFLPAFSPPTQAALYDLDRFLMLVK